MGRGSTLAGVHGVAGSGTKSSLSFDPEVPYFSSSGQQTPLPGSRTGSPYPRLSSASNGGGHGGGGGRGGRGGSDGAFSSSSSSSSLLPNHADADEC